MFLTRWNKTEAPTRRTFGQLFDLRDELDRLFESPLAHLTQTSRLLNGWSPAVDFYENKDSFVVKAELPGLKREDIQVTLQDDNNLVISGERKGAEKQAESETYREERFYGRFERVIALPGNVKALKADNVNASYQDGVLTVTLPKSEEARPKSIEVKVN